MSRKQGILKRIFQQVVYLRITSERMRFLHCQSGRVEEFTPVLTVARDTASGEYLIEGVGELTSRAGISHKEFSKLNPFEHPRSLLNDFEAAERLFEYGLRRVFERSLFAPSPLLVIQPEEKLEGGLTGPEHRAWVELGRASGARKTIVHTGDVLSPESAIELMTHNYSR